MSFTNLGLIAVSMTIQQQAVRNEGDLADSCTTDDRRRAVMHTYYGDATHIHYFVHTSVRILKVDHATSVVYFKIRANDELSSQRLQATVRVRIELETGNTNQDRGGPSVAAFFSSRRFWRRTTQRYRCISAEIRRTSSTDDKKIRGVQNDILDELFRIDPQLASTIQTKLK